MAGFARLFNGRIHDKSYAEVNLYDGKYNGHIIALYFSANWCPLCNIVTPLLIGFHEELHPEKKVKVIYISSDHDEQSFHQYYQTMPGFALDYRDWQKRADLLKVFQVNALPKLVLIDGDTGRILSMNGVDHLFYLDRQRDYYNWSLHY